jgi:hypothetical protein
MTRPSPERLLSETARLAYHLHWQLDTILDLQHSDRRRFLRKTTRWQRSADVGRWRSATPLPVLRLARFVLPPRTAATRRG